MFIVFYGLSKIFRSRAIFKSLKIKMYLTLLKPIAFYGAETWSLRKTEELRMAVFEKKIFRKMYGSPFDAQTNYWKKLGGNFPLQDVRIRLVDQELTGLSEHYSE